MSSQCRHRYKDGERTCPNPPVKGCILCRKHRYSIKKKPEQYNILTNEGKIRKPEEKPVQENSEEEYDKSLCSIQENEEEMSNTSTVYTDKNNELIDISRNFVFECIDLYFERHNKRTERLNNFKSGGKKSGGGFDMTTIMGIAGVSLAPLIGNYLKNNLPNNSINNINKDGANDKREFIPMVQPTRPEPDDEKSFIHTDNPEQEKFVKVC